MPTVAPTTTHEKAREHWLGERRKYICATDIVSICGASPYAGGTPLNVWLNKMGQDQPFEETYAMRRGTFMEEFVAREYQREYGTELIHKPFELAPHHDSTKFPHFACTPDRILKDQKVGLEIKSVGSHLVHKWGESGSDDVPPEVVIQSSWCMACFDFNEWHVGAELGGQGVRFYRLERDETLIEGLYDRANAFWEDFVIPKEQPEIDGTEASKRFLEAKFPTPNEEIIEVDSDFGFIMETLEKVKAVISENETTRDGLSNVLRQRIGEAYGLSYGKLRALWSHVKGRKSINWEAIACHFAEKKLSGKDAIVKEHTTQGEGYRMFKQTRAK